MDDSRWITFVITMIIFTVIYMLLLERILGIVIRRGCVWELVGKEMLLLCGFPVLAVIVLYCVTAMESGIYQCIASIVMGKGNLKYKFVNRHSVP